MKVVRTMIKPHLWGFYLFTFILLVLGSSFFYVQAHWVEQEEKDVQIVQVVGPYLEYKVTGEAQLFEGTYFYRVKLGKNEILKEGSGTSSMGGPQWGSFSFIISLPKNKVDQNHTLELYEIDEKTGTEINKLVVPLDKWSDQIYQNSAFRKVQVSMQVVDKKRK